MRIGDVAGFSSMPLICGGAGTVVSAEGILCTEESIFWTTRRRAPGDPPGEEVLATANALDFANVLGSKVTDRRKGEVAVWIEDGPTAHVPHRALRRRHAARLRRRCSSISMLGRRQPAARSQARLRFWWGTNADRQGCSCV